LGLKYPGLQDELEEFLQSQQAGGADPQALYVVWAGANDFFFFLQSGGNPAGLISAGVSNTVQAVQALFSAGARQILVVNIPDLGLTPLGLGSGMSPGITELCGVYNGTLEAALDTLADAGVPTIRVDAFATLQAMVEFPVQFGFTNVTESFLATGGDPARFLFWDVVHPTTHGHEILANQARSALIDYYSPRNGIGNPPNLINCLNGLAGGRPGRP
jgi:phospholipase/lecithinase/hemolysin